MFKIDLFLLLFFFFQAEDGIRDRDVTGVQTCALPILRASPGRARGSPPPEGRCAPGGRTRRSRRRSWSRTARLPRSEEHTSELQSHHDLVCRLLLEKKKQKNHQKLPLTD